jgi:hypothetical protein
LRRLPRLPMDGGMPPSQRPPDRPPTRAEATLGLVATTVPYGVLLAGLTGPPLLLTLMRWHRAATRS